MKTTLAPLFILMLILSMPACKKDMETSYEGPAHSQTYSLPGTLNGTPYPQSGLVTCQFSPDYGDSIVFPQPVNGPDYIVSPVNNQGITGSYLAWPDGLSINPVTGAIDVTKSVSGIRYDIGFVQTGTTDTCLSSLIVGGVSYADSVYVLSTSDTTSAPYFNGNPYGPNICDGSGPDDGNKCKFDIYQEAKNQGIIVDKKTGYIDLKKSMKKNMFGPIPFDGQTVNTSFSYQLTDQSNNAIQQMQITFVYYSDKSQIPANLIGVIDGKLTNILNDILVAKAGSPKPPLIIITRN